MIDQLIKSKRWEEGPGIKLEFYVANQKVERIILSSSLNQGIDLEIWSTQVEENLFLDIEEWLDQYSMGENPEVIIPLNLDSQPPFTKQVLMTMQKVCFGEVCTYGDLARRSGFPRAARAVGSACRRNPFPLLIPCHRVLDSGHKLCGYSAGGGLTIKKKLLEYEEVF